MSESEVLRRLERLFEAVDQAVPDPPVAPTPVLRVLDPSRRRPRRWIVPIGAAGIVMAAASGAAVAGVAPLDQILGNAGQLATSPTPARVPTALVRVTEPGPEATTVRVFSAAGSNNDRHVATCTTLRLYQAHGGAVPGGLSGNSVCDIVGAEGQAPLSPAQQVQAGVAGQAVAQWLSPSGQSYAFVYGQAVVGTATVELADTAGQVAVSEPVQDGWFAIYLDSVTYQSYDRLRFVDSAGKVVAVLPG